MPEAHSSGGQNNVSRCEGRRVAIATSLALHVLAFVYLLSAPPVFSTRNEDTVMMVEIISEVQETPEPKPEPAPLEPVLKTPPEPLAAPEPDAAPAPDPVLKPKLIPKPKSERVQSPPVRRTTPITPAPVSTSSVAVHDAQQIEQARMTARNAELKRYAKTVWKHVLRHKPATARKPGAVKMHFSIAADGTLLGTEVAVSSGVPMLDRMAVEVLRRAQPFPRPPAMIVPAVFNLTFEFR